MLIPAVIHYSAHLQPPIRVFFLIGAFFTTSDTYAPYSKKTSKPSKFLLYRQAAFLYNNPVKQLPREIDPYFDK